MFPGRSHSPRVRHILVHRQVVEPDGEDAFPDHLVGGRDRVHDLAFPGLDLLLIRLPATARQVESGETER